MKRETKIPADVQNKLLTAHERALMKIMKKNSILVPMHTANMAVLNYQTKETEIRKTVIPAIIINISGTQQDGKIDRQNVSYLVAMNGKPFPLAHVYSSSGSLCLGSIFVPSQIPVYSPQQPLETLFLHNDRHVSHGNPNLDVSESNLQDLKDLVARVLPDENINILNGKQIINEDIIWYIGAQVLEHYTKDEALEIMHEAFNYLFQNKQKEN